MALQKYLSDSRFIDKVLYKALKIILLIASSLISFIIILSIFLYLHGPVHSIKIGSFLSKFISSYLLPNSIDVKIEDASISWDNNKHGLKVTLSSLNLINNQIKENDQNISIKIPDISLIVVFQNLFSNYKDNKIFNIVLKNYDITSDKIKKISYFMSKFPGFQKSGNTIKSQEISEIKEIIYRYFVIISKIDLKNINFHIPINQFSESRLDSEQDLVINFTKFDIVKNNFGNSIDVKTFISIDGKTKSPMVFNLNLGNFQKESESLISKISKKKHDIEDKNDKNLLISGKILKVSYEPFKKFNIKILDNFYMLFDFWFKVYLDDNLNLDKISFIVSSGGECIMRKADTWEQDFNIDQLYISSLYEYKQNQLNVHEIDIKNSHGLNLSGFYSFDITNKISKGEFITTNININDFYLYWPLHYGESARKWTSMNLRNGKINRADFKFQFQHKNLNFNQKKKSFLTSKINIENADLIYHYPDKLSHNIKIKHGEINFDENAMKAIVPEASMDNIKLTNFKINIPDMKSDKSNLEITGDINTSLESTAKLGLSHIQQDMNKLDSKNNNKQNSHIVVILSKLIQMKGDVQNKLRLNILLSGKDDNDTFNLESNIKNLEFIQKNQNTGNNIYKINSNNLLFQYKNQLIHLKGDWRINDDLINGDLEINQSLLKDNKINKYDIENKMKKSKTNGNIKISSINLSKIQYKNTMLSKINGTINGDIKLNIFEQKLNLKSDLNIANSEVETKLGIKKALNQKGNIKIETILDLNQISNKDLINNKRDLINYEMNTEQFFSKGKIIIDLNSIKEINAEQIKWKDNNLTILYKNLESKHEFNIAAEKLDISKIEIEKILYGEIEEGEKVQSVKKKKSENYNRFNNLKKEIIINVKAELLKLNNKQNLINTKIETKISKNGLDKFYLRGNWDQFPNQHATIFFDNQLLAISSNNAGKFFKAFNLYQKVNNGIFDFRALYKNQDWMGRAYLTNFTLSNAPIFTEILKISNLTSVPFFGMFDILNIGKIKFNKSRCELDLNGTYLNFKNCFANGNTVNIYADASLNLKSKDMYSSGFVEPVSFLTLLKRNFQKKDEETELDNTNIERKNNQVNFTVTGNLKDKVKINVNPLSVVAPSFLGKMLSSKPQLKVQGDNQFYEEIHLKELEAESSITK